MRVRVDGAMRLMHDATHASAASGDRSLPSTSLAAHDVDVRWRRVNAPMALRNATTAVAGPRSPCAQWGARPHTGRRA